jgi:chloramphenicol-sensitive protein RarD
VTERTRGLIHGVIAYALWGIVAAYWKLLSHVSPIELLAHRALWGLLAFLLLAAVAKQCGLVIDALRDLRVLATMAVSATLLAINWGIFVWATVSGHLLDASLGYFNNPLVSVAFGTLVLRERLSRMQWIAILLAATGVALLTLETGRVPWVALALAATFGVYGLVRKTARVDALVGSTVETVLIAPLALGYLLITPGAFGHSDLSTHLLLAGTGVVTAVPLVMFASSARRLPLSTVGFLQYLAPTGQFLLAALAFGEPVPLERLAAFAVIWAGLAVFSIDLWRRRPPAAA